MRRTLPFFVLPEGHKPVFAIRPAQCQQLSNSGPSDEREQDDGSKLSRTRCQNRSLLVVSEDPRTPIIDFQSLDVPSRRLE